MYRKKSVFRFCRSTLYIERERDFFIEAGKTKRLHFHPD